jgi:hypothetical protein
MAQPSPLDIASLVAAFLLAHHALFRFSLWALDAAAAGGGKGAGGVGLPPPQAHQPPPEDGGAASGRRGLWRGLRAALGGLRAALGGLRARVCQLDAGTRRRAALYLLSSLHSNLVAWLSLYLLAAHGGMWNMRAVEASDAMLAKGGPAAYSAPGWGLAPYSLMASLLAYSLAYFLHDLAVTAPRWRAHPADALHHVAGALLVATCLAHPGAARQAHHVLVTEASTPLLNAMWAVKKLRLEGVAGGAPMRALMAAFTATFAATRLLYLPLVTLATCTHMHGTLEGKPHVPAAMLALCALNGHWFLRIVGMLRRVAASPTGELPSSGSGEGHAADSPAGQGHGAAKVGGGLAGGAAAAAAAAVVAGGKRGRKRPRR